MMIMSLSEAVSQDSLFLVDAMNIEDKEDKEFIISEIYTLQNNTIDGELEVSMLGKCFPSTNLDCKSG